MCLWSTRLFVVVQDHQRVCLWTNAMLLSVTNVLSCAMFSHTAIAGILQNHYDWFRSCAYCTLSTPLPSSPLCQDARTWSKQAMCLFVTERFVLVQDYHRFHFLTKATLVSITNVPGRLYTVNPIAINSPFANVLTQNKRAICMYDTPEYGPVAFVVIGATMVCEDRR